MGRVQIFVRSPYGRAPVDSFTAIGPDGAKLTFHEGTFDVGTDPVVYPIEGNSLTLGHGLMTEEDLREVVALTPTLEAGQEFHGSFGERVNRAARRAA